MITLAKLISYLHNGPRPSWIASPELAETLLLEHLQSAGAIVLESRITRVGGPNWIIKATFLRRLCSWFSWLGYRAPESISITGDIRHSAIPGDFSFAYEILGCPWSRTSKSVWVKRWTCRDFNLLLLQL